MKFIQALSNEVQSLEQTVAGFAQSFVSDNITVNDTLCIKKSDGTPVCVTGDQLAVLLASTNTGGEGGNQSPTVAQPSSPSASSTPEFVTQNSTSTTPATNPPTVTVNGDNPAVVHVGDSYADLGATVSDTGAGQAGDTNLGLKTFLNGTLVSNIVLDTTAVATDTIDYVATDQSGLTATSTRAVIIEPATSSTATEATSTAQ